MKTTLFGAAALALMLASGTAIAQQAPVDQPNVTSDAANPSADTTAAIGTYASDDERNWYSDNTEMLRGFFTDDTMGTLKSEDEVKAAFDAMGADDQAGMKTACERANENPGSFGSVTKDLCARVGLM